MTPSSYMIKFLKHYKQKKKCTKKSCCIVIGKYCSVICESYIKCHKIALLLAKKYTHLTVDNITDIFCNPIRLKFIVNIIKLDTG